VRPTITAICLRRPESADRRKIERTDMGCLPHRVGMVPAADRTASLCQVLITAFQPILRAVIVPYSDNLLACAPIAGEAYRGDFVAGLCSAARTRIIQRDKPLEPQDRN
jgi:hypothetical protein